MGLLGVAVLGCIGAVCLLVLLVHHLQNRRRYANIPGPRSYPVVGNVLQLLPKPEAWFAQVAGTCCMFTTPLRMCCIWIATKPYVMLYGADVIEPILGSSRHIEKGYEYSMMHPWLGRGLLTASASTWRPRRKLLTPAFHYDILKEFVDVFNQQALILTEKIMSLSSGGTNAVEVASHLTLCALDIICESAMGQSVGAQSNEQSDYVTAVHEINDIIHHRQKEPWNWVDWVFWHFGSGKRHAWCLSVLHGFTDKVITERRNQLRLAGGAATALEDQANNNRMQNLNDSTTSQPAERGRLAFLDLLLLMEDQGKLPQGNIREEVDTFMFEGHDTTTAAMTWSLHLLACHPEIQQKVHRELDSVLGCCDNVRSPVDVDYASIGKLKYLECCIKEALRLFPSVPVFSRMLTVDQTIGEYVVPCGTQVVVNSFMTHRDPKYWPDPEKYDPDRFLPENTVGRHPYAFVPFSAGGRNCIGQRFALMEEKVVLAWVLRQFTVRPAKRLDQVNLFNWIYITRSVCWAAVPFSVLRVPKVLLILRFYSHVGVRYGG